MLKPRNFLLVTDLSHPEIFSIANALSNEKIPFTIVSSLIITRKQLEFLKRFRIVSRSMITKMESRAVDSNQVSTALVRVALFTEFFFRLLNKFPSSMRGGIWFRSISNLDESLKKAYRAKASDILKQGNFSHVIYLSTLTLQKYDDSVNFIEIAFHGNVTQEVIWRNFAILQFPHWESTWKIPDLISAQEPRSSKSHFLPHKVVYASSFNSLNSKQGIDSICSPLGAIKTGTMKHHLKTKEISLIHVGQLSLRKGIPLILEVATRIPVDFILCGSGSAEVISKIQNAHNPRIKLSLNPSDQVIKANLASSQIFILPSYYEGFGIAILEAMSFGCIPIISTNTCGPDILRGTELEKFIVSPGSVTDLENAIRRVIELEHSERMRLGDLASTISQNFTISSYGKNVLKHLSN